MEPFTLLLNHSCIYWIFAVAISLVFAVQGALIQRHEVEKENRYEIKRWKRWEPWLIHYPEYFLYNLVCSLAGFGAFYVESRILVSLPDLSNISGGTATFLVFLSLMSILGISGKLSYILLHARFLMPK
jgi:hypothetical protein